MRNTRCITRAVTCDQNELLYGQEFEVSEAVRPHYNVLASHHTTRIADDRRCRLSPEIAPRLLNMCVAAQALDKDFTLPLDKAQIIREGTDVTITCFSRMCNVALEVGPMPLPILSADTLLHSPLTMTYRYFNRNRGNGVQYRHVLRPRVSANHLLEHPMSVLLLP